MLRNALENILRSWPISVPTILVLAITLMLFHGLLVINGKAQEMQQVLLRKFSITVYLKTGADSLETASLVTRLEQRNDVIPPVIYTGSREALTHLNETFSFDPSLFKQYNVELPASLTITPRQPEDTPRIERFLREIAPHLLEDPLETSVKRKNVTEQMLQFLGDVKKNVQQAFLVFLIFFVAGGGLLTASAVSAALASRKLEITIMRLVGARRQHIAAPFVAEGILMGVSAWTLHAATVLILGLPLSAAVQWNALLLEFAAVAAVCAGASYAAVTVAGRG